MFESLDWNAVGAAAVALFGGIALTIVALGLREKEGKAERAKLEEHVRYQLRQARYGVETASISLDDSTVTWWRGRFALCLEYFESKGGVYRVCYIDGYGNRRVLSPEEVAELIMMLEETSRELQENFKYQAQV